MKTYELNIDGLVGPTHHYAGLSPGNLASTQNAFTVSNPADAALQGIAKIRLLHDLGIPQAVLPPHERPNLAFLKALGFTGSPAEQVRKAKLQDPFILSASYSASSMWAANAATVAPSVDTFDNKVHFTPANLIQHAHRHHEAEFTNKLLMQIFANSDYFIHHAPLPRTILFSDEGAANHNRLCSTHSGKGIHLFVYGKHGLPKSAIDSPRILPARQTLEASQAVARLNQLDTNKVIFVQQHPNAIDAGVFHNDVIACVNESVFLLHEHAFVAQTELLQNLQRTVDFPLYIIEVKNSQISIDEAVESYLFNSQILTDSTNNMMLIAPIECEQNPRIKIFIDELLADLNPIKDVYYLNLRQSMRNGGGPACLRLRVVLTETELAAVHPGVIVNHNLLESLEKWVKTHFRTKLHVDDLDDPALLTESYTALDELTKILHLGSIYPFQS